MNVLERLVKSKPRPQSNGEFVAGLEKGCSRPIILVSASVLRVPIKWTALNPYDYTSGPRSVPGAITLD